MSMWKRPNSNRAGTRSPDFSDLSQPVKSPDVTRAVMGRLGYMKVSAKVSRRHRLNRWGSRAGLTLAALMALGIGWRVHDAGSRARRPLEGNIPAALGNDLQKHRVRFEDVIQTIRRAAPSGPLQMPADLAPDDEDDQGLPVNDDLQQLAGLPMRWV
jgi:hypothetical protein